MPLSDVRQAEQLLYAATSEVPQLEEQIQQQENAIAFLLGENPGPIVTTIPMRLRLHRRIFPQVCLRNFSSGGPIFSRPKRH